VHESSPNAKTDETGIQKRFDYGEQRCDIDDAYVNGTATKVRALVGSAHRAVVFFTPPSAVDVEGDPCVSPR